MLDNHTDEVSTQKCGLLNKIWGGVREYIYIPLTVIGCLVLFTVILIVGVVPSESMEPLCKAGSFYVGNRLAYVGSEVQRGDVIFFNFDADTVYVKRVIGLPGDEVTFPAGSVAINGEVLDEPYLPAGTLTCSDVATFVVPDGCYFVMGDNRGNSADARYWDDPYISQDDIIGQYLWSVAIPFWGT